MSFQTARIAPNVASDRAAADVRRQLQAHRTCAFDFVATTAAGTTSLLERVLRRLSDRLAIGVLCGIREDAERLGRCGACVIHVPVQDPDRFRAGDVLAALERIDLARTDLVFIERGSRHHGRAAADLGVDSTVAVVGADALPETGAVRDLLGGADYAIVTKVDLAGTGQRVADARARWRGAFPALRVFACSAETGEGLDDWCTLLEARVGDAVIA